MGVFDRLEGKLERAVHGAFSKAFRAEVQPVEIASAIRRAMDDRAASARGHGKRTPVPNLFLIQLSPTDYARLEEQGDQLEAELIAAAEEHAETQHYSPGGPFDIVLEQSESLDTGVFQVRPGTAKRPRPTGTTGTHQNLDGAPDLLVDNPSGYAAPNPSGYAAPSPRAHQAPLGPARDAATARPAPRINPAERPWLNVDGDRYPLMSAITILGRDESADIIVDDPGISRRHTEIRIVHDGPSLRASIRDLGSTNGTFLNGEPIERAQLSDNDRITVGRTTMTYRHGRR